MKKVILINPPSNGVNDDHLEPQLGLLHIASVLRENNIPVQIYDMTGCKPKEHINKKIENILSGDIIMKGHENKHIYIPNSYNYTTAFLTMACPRGCSYCINRYDNFQLPKRISGKKWIKSLKTSLIQIFQ